MSDECQLSQLRIQRENLEMDLRVVKLQNSKLLKLKEDHCLAANTLILHNVEKTREAIVKANIARRQLAQSVNETDLSGRKRQRIDN